MPREMHTIGIVEEIQRDSPAHKPNVASVDIIPAQPFGHFDQRLAMLRKLIR